MKKAVLVVLTMALFGGFVYACGAGDGTSASGIRAVDSTPSSSPVDGPSHALTDTTSALTDTISALTDTISASAWQASVSHGEISAERPSSLQQAPLVDAPAEVVPSEVVPSEVVPSEVVSDTGDTSIPASRAEALVQPIRASSSTAPSARRMTAVAVWRAPSALAPATVDLNALASGPLPRASREEAGADPIRVDDLRESFRILLPSRELVASVRPTRGYPSSTISTPTAFGARWGQVYAGASYQNRIRYDDWRDGILTMGGGLGNPDRYVGLEVTANVLDTYDDFAEDRSLSLKLHRRLPFASAVAVGWENIWHTSGTDGGSSRYVIGSKIIRFRERPTTTFGAMVVSVGLGEERFLPEDQFARGEEGVNLFGSVGLRLLRPVNAVANWTGQDLNLGLSIAPVRTWPLVITPAMVDVTGRAGDGARFTMSVGLGYNLRR